jgi:DNA-binding beta-propeller fold protein YncE
MTTRPRALISATFSIATAVTATALLAAGGGASAAAAAPRSAGLAVLSPAGAAAAKQLGRGREFAPRDAYVHHPLSAPGGSLERSFLPFVGPSGFFGSSLVGSAPVGAGPSTLAVDPATHTIYVANGFNPSGNSVGGNTVSVIDSRHCNAHDVSHCRGPWPTITVGNLPSTIAIDQSTDTVYVTNAGDNTVSVFNGTTCNALDTAGCGQTAATVPVGPFPDGIFADSANHTVYVANFGNLVGDTVSMIDSAACTGTDLAACPTTAPPAVTVGLGPGDVDVDQATHTVYVALSPGVAAFDADTCNATVQSGCAAVGMLAGDPAGEISAKVDPANDTLYTANYDNTISVYDLSSCNASDLSGCAGDSPGTVTPKGQAGFETNTWLAVDTALNSVYVAYQKDDALMVVNANVCNGAHLAACASLNPPEIHTGSDPESVALDPLTQTLYVANQDDNDVSVIAASRCDAQTTRGCRPRVPEVPNVSGALASDPAVHTTYVASSATAVAMIDDSTCNAFHTAGCAQAPPTVTVGAYPSAVADDPITHTVYVANSGAGASGTISVFDDRTCNATNQAGCGTVSTLNVPDGNPVGLAVNPVTDTLYAATLTNNGGPDLISVFNGSTCNATTTGGCGQTPANAATGPDGGAPFASTESVAVNAATNTVYATSDVLDANPFIGDSVYVINGSTCDAADTNGCSEPPATVDLGSNATFGDANPFGIAVDPATDTIYTANIFNGEGPGTVSVINGATCNGENTSGCGQIPATAPAAFGTVAIAVDQWTNHVYATNIEDTSVTTINGNRCNGTNASGCDDTRTDAIVGDYPGSISVDPFVGSAYVADSEGVSVIWLTP